MCVVAGGVQDGLFVLHDGPPGLPWQPRCCRDIINQVLSIPQSGSLTNIVFMGMGEPMDNLRAVMDAVEVLTAPWGLGWSPKRITVSTIGKMRELRELLEETKVHVAVSVHSPFAQERRGLMPVENAYPVRDVMEMLRGYDFAHQRRLSVEYIMWRGVNDSMRHADALARLIRGTSGACEPDTSSMR